MRTSVALAVLLMASPAVAQPTVPRASLPVTSRSAALLTSDDLNRIVLLLLRGGPPGVTSQRQSAALVNIRRRMGLS